ncbi:HDOD domain-containing protein [Methyloterricola oryzae]|uniref:HDOD domain-containing protein n=1 Tax=Methyloterricola oryzae TaxID=1495050 RepID=UPI0005EBED8D|nr:HDOD domain-containing protein [Methyloterricola oryzae]
MDLKNTDEFLQYILAAVESNKLELPTLPEVALSVRQAINSQNASDAEIARIIAQDPGLAARLLQIANSPLFRARQKIDNLQTAITRLGRNTVRTLIISLAMNQLFKPKQIVLEQYFHEIWKQSVNVSAVARALALRCGHLDKEQAMLAGLLHQIGKLPILTLAERFPELAQDKAVLDGHLRNLHTVIGKLVLEKWDMPQALVSVASEYLDFKRDSGPQADYVDLVQIAFVESELLRSPQLALEIADMPAFRKLGLDSEIEVLEIEGVAESVQECEQILL